MQQFVKKMALLIVIASAVAGVASAQSDSWACNNALIKGVYGFTIEGTKLGGNGPVGPQVGVAMTEFYGDGTLEQIDSVTIDGNHAAQLTEAPTLGTYTVNPNCTGSFRLNFKDGRPTVLTDFVIVDDGKEIDTVVTGALAPDGVTILSILATRSIGKRRFSPSLDSWQDRAETGRVQ
jgi:hypothetical protein